MASAMSADPCEVTEGVEGLSRLSAVQTLLIAAPVIFIGALNAQFLEDAMGET